MEPAPRSLSEEAAPRSLSARVAMNAGEKTRLVAEQGAPSPAERWKPTRTQSVGLFTVCAALMSMQPLLQNLSKDSEVCPAPSTSRDHLVHAACAAVDVAAQARLAIVVLRR